MSIKYADGTFLVGVVCLAQTGLCPRKELETLEGEYTFASRETGTRQGRRKEPTPNNSFFYFGRLRAKWDFCLVIMNIYGKYLAAYLQDWLFIQKADRITFDICL